MHWPILFLIPATLAISWPLTWLCRRLAHRIGQVDQPGHRKIHTHAIPVTGGIAIFSSFFFIIAVGYSAIWLIPQSTWHSLLPDLLKHIAGAKDQAAMAATFLASLLLLHVVGLIDDRTNLGPYSKLIAQIVAASALVLFFDVRLMEWVDPYLGPIPSICVTIIWFLVITNAFNFLDNMDGLSAGIATICASIILATAILSGQWFIAALLATLIGSLLGFLIFNFPPASIFMGDAGSLVVGFILAFCAVRVTYYDPQSHTNWWAVFTPLIVLAIPLYDLTSVTLLRLAQGKSPLQGDTQHFSHRLVKRGLSRRAAVVVIYACTLATGLGGILIGRLNNWQAVLIIFQTASVLLVLALLEKTPQHPDHKL